MPTSNETNAFQQILFFFHRLCGVEKVFLFTILLTKQNPLRQKLSQDRLNPKIEFLAFIRTKDVIASAALHSCSQLKKTIRKNMTSIT